MLSRRSHKQGGFSLVELMVVVAIIGILSAIALPKFRTFQAKAKQAEAKLNLASIHTLEAAYQAENDTYINMAAITQGSAPATTNVIGFFPADPAHMRYDYSVTGATTSAFQGNANSGAGAANKVSPGCNTRDTWTIDQDKVLTNTSNSVTSC